MLKTPIRTLIVALALLASTLSARAEGDVPAVTYASFANGDLLTPGQAAKFEFTVSSQDTVYFLYAAPTVSEAYILNAVQFQRFQSGLAFSSPGGFRNESGRRTMTLPAGTYSVGVRNTGSVPLDYGFRVVSASNILSVRAAGTEALLSGGRVAKPFTVNPGDKMQLAVAAEGIEGYIIPPSSVNAFLAGLPFVPVTGQPILTALNAGSASGDIDLNPGTFYIAFRNPTAFPRAAPYVISAKRPVFTGGGPVVPPTSVTPFFSSSTDEGVGGTFDGEVFRTRFNNRNASTAPSFLVQGATPGQFVRIYADDVLIAQGVAGAAEATVKANGRAALSEGTYTVTATQFNGQTESAPIEVFDIFIDTLAPAPPANLDLAPASDTGESNQDDITSANSLTFTGTSEPLARILITVQGRVFGTPTVQANETGDWTATFNFNPTGKFKFAALQLDTAGNISKASSPVTVTVLKRPNAPGRPALIKADKGKTTNGATNTANPQPTFTGSAGKGNTVTLQVDGNDAETVVADNRGKWSVTLSTPLSLGEHAVRVKQTDLAGGVSPFGSALIVRFVE